MRSVTKVLVGGLLAASLAALAGCASLPQSEPNAGREAAAAPMATGAPAAVSAGSDGDDSSGVRVAIVGDSLTAGGGRSLSAGLTPDTWMTYAEGHGIDYVGGWAVGGTTAQIMAEAVKPMHDIDVLVLMAGTNDVRLHYSFAQARSSYDSIVRTIGAKHVIIGAIPPYNHNPNAAAAYERQLRAYVASKGWDFVDPWGFARDGRAYAPGTSLDGTHPTTAGYRRIGLAYRDAILRVASTPQKG